MQWGSLLDGTECYDRHPSFVLSEGVGGVKSASPPDERSAYSLCKQTKTSRSLPQGIESLPVTTAKLQSVACGQLVKSCSRPANTKLLPVQLSMYPVSSFCTPLPFSTLHIHFLFLAFLFLFISAVKPLKYPRSSSGSEGCPVRGSLFNLTVQINLPSAPLLTVYVEKLPHIWSQQCSVLH